MDNTYTHICIVLDASGSMEPIIKDVKGTFNTFIRAEKKEPGKTFLDIYQFSDETRRIVEREDIKSFREDFMNDYECNGCTAMNDAICTAIDTLGSELAATNEENRPHNVIFAIITDGYENASKIYTLNDVKNRIKEQTDKYNWHFQFLAANQDAIEAGQSMNINSASCYTFAHTSDGMKDAIRKFYTDVSICRSTVDDCCNVTEEILKMAEAKADSLDFDYDDTTKKKRK